MLSMITSSLYLSRAAVDSACKAHKGSITVCKKSDILGGSVPASDVPFYSPRGFWLRYMRTCALHNRLFCLLTRHGAMRNPQPIAASMLHRLRRMSTCVTPSTLFKDSQRQ
jgi:hypothetical protein